MEKPAFIVRRFPGPWPAMSVQHRDIFIRAASENLLENLDEIADGFVWLMARQLAAPGSLAKAAVIKIYPAMFVILTHVLEP